jgi:hypothetical protein
VGGELQNASVSEFYGIRVEPHAIHGWSTRRLPFEPTGWLKDYREALRQALRSLPPVEGTHLRAVYASPRPELVDVENVLLYNVGSGNYHHLTRSGLEVLRTVSADALHHVTYQLTTRSAAELSVGEVLASVSLDALPEDRDKPGSWWAAMRSRMTTPGGEPEAGYTVDILVTHQTSSFVSAVKPMLDGLISSLHVHDGSHRDHLLAALARYGDPAELWALLNDPTTSVLGRRTLVRPHGRGIAWNPADDLCSGFRIMHSARGPLLTARVHSGGPELRP